MLHPADPPEVDVGSVPLVLGVGDIDSRVSKLFTIVLNEV